MKYFFFLMLGMLCLSASVNAQNSPFGVWKSIDDKTGEAKSHVEVYQKNGKLYGKIVKF